MSSILDALKKAEQEAAIDRQPHTPWPLPSRGAAADRPLIRRWWLPMGLIAALACAAAVWLTRPPEPIPPVVVEKTAPQVFAVEPSRPAPTPTPRIAEAPVTPPTPAFPAAAAKPMVPAMQPPDTRHQTPPPSPAPAETGPNSPPPSSAAKQTAVIPEPVTAPPAAAIPPAPQKTEKARQATMTPEKDAKNFRSDPRIELQALVWAPESVDRFVVINNRLIKEGGAVDDIVVVQINRDDVLLADGTDRWHQAFKIR